MTSTETSCEPAAFQPVIPFGTSEIQKLLPHRYPFLLVDRVIEFHAGHRIVAYKNVTLNEEFFQGHFPVQPVMPGVLVIEALAQAGGVLYQLTNQIKNGGRIDNKLFYLVKIENARFSKMVVPGDRLELDITLKRRIRNMAMYDGIARVDGKEAARAEFLCAESQD
ncbi:MAG: 3-hydroxyacyl-ACP dehydratase FabZ [Pseudomonadota bacterium]